MAHRKRPLSLIAILALSLAFPASPNRAADGPASPFAQHPAANALNQLFAPDANPPLTPTGIQRADYLKLIAGNVDFFKAHQAENGAIIDPYLKREFQYSTPAFALSAALLATQANRKDLLDPATKALTVAITELAAGTTADGHADFYIPLVMQARRLLNGKAPAQTLAAWDANLKRLDPATSYNTKLRAMNWNIVNTSGELLRRKDGLVDDAKRDAQLAYIEDSLAGHLPHLTRFGMYDDPGEPLAYDAFARLWLELFMTDGAYDGKIAPQLQTFLSNGSLSTLLLQSPNGEWASGGRSAFHQWNEAEIAAICEMEAKKWHAAAHPDVAGAFKRAAHLAYQSMARWQRPSGEMWIVKNRAEPDSRLGFETYSGHSQYNLFAAAMLAMAYQQADETIPETLIPAERGGYVFDLRETFHKVVAAAGGYYVEIDTDADPHYNATGMQRIMRAGVSLSPLSDSTCAQRAYGPASGAKRALAPGLEWKAGAGWLSLAALQKTQAELKIITQTPARVAFDILYKSNDQQITESYVLTAEGVDLTTTLSQKEAEAMRAVLPALINDGKEPTTVKRDGAHAAITLRGSTLHAQLLSPANLTLALDGEKIAAHTGIMQTLVADLPAGTQVVHWHFSLQTSEK